MISIEYDGRWRILTENGENIAGEVLAVDIDADRVYPTATLTLKRPFLRLLGLEHNVSRRYATGADHELWAALQESA